MIKIIYRYKMKIAVTEQGKSKKLKGKRKKKNGLRGCLKSLILKLRGNLPMLAFTNQKQSQGYCP
jgi:hypothetical protein